MVYWKEQQFARAHEFWLQALKCSPEDEDFLYWFALAEKRLRTEAPLSGSSEVGSR
jgi:hypothetical protein